MDDGLKFIVDQLKELRAEFNDLRKEIAGVSTTYSADYAEVRCRIEEIAHRHEELASNLNTYWKKHDTLKGEFQVLESKIKTWVAILTGVMGTLFFLDVPSKVKALIAR